MCSAVRARGVGYTAGLDKTRREISSKSLRLWVGGRSRGMVPYSWGFMYIDRVGGVESSRGESRWA